ncbi:MAG: FHA domain-containing protein [Desulfobacterales bacterium]|jgi:pSer/pThr/pTyr-binding forkhead associated (FHA) protein|nr:FHA domain-containing protein [Deltaproteobacteria bacterium]
MLEMELRFKDKTLKQIKSDKNEITIGRGNNNDIIIDNLAVSKEHAKIIKLPDGYELVDLDSTNGTLLNDKDIKKAKLVAQDVLTIGKHTLKIKSTDPPKAAAADLVDKTVKVSPSK